MSVHNRDGVIHKSGVTQKAEIKIHNYCVVNNQLLKEQPIKLSIDDPADLVAVIPYWLGYQPDNHVAVLAHQDGEVLAGCCFDIEWICGEAEQKSRDRTDDWCRSVERLRAQHKNARFFLVGFGSADLADEALAHAEIVIGAGLVDLSVVANEQNYWLRSRGERPGWCDGHVLDVSSSKATSAAICAGLQIYGKRYELVKMVQGPAEDETSQQLWRWAWQRASQNTLGAAEKFIDEMTQSDSFELPDQRDLALLGVLVQQVVLRDKAWLAMDMKQAWRHEKLWLGVVAVTPVSAAPAVLCLAAAAAWLAGGGAIFTECLRRCAQIDPTYSMLDLLREIHDRAIQPTLWQKMGENRAARMSYCAAPSRM